METCMEAIRKELDTLTDFCTVVYVSLRFWVLLTHHAMADSAPILFYKTV